jgi:tetratricopeptide (TPR) repeat protein
MVDMFGITNVPFGLWVDEQGTIVRPPEVAFAPRDEQRDAATRAQLAQMKLDPARMAVIQETTKHTTGDMNRYANAMRDWAANGAHSQHVLPADEVIARSRPRPAGAARAAAEFELAQHLHRQGHHLDAVPHFQEAHRLDPENWSYARQAYALVDESMGNPYGTDLLSEVARVGAATFYPDPQL